MKKLSSLLTLLLLILSIFVFAGCTKECEHNWSDATCTQSKTCSLCNETEGFALGHSYTFTIKNPTCTENGYTTYTCGICNHRYSDNTVEATGHTTTTGICSNCNTRQGWTEAEVREIIQIRSIYVDDINSAGGVDMEIQWKNTSSKTIKYIYFTVEPYNAVGDRVPCEIRGFKDFTGYCTGPFESNYTSWWYWEYDDSYNGGSHWSNCWYNNTIETLKLTKLKIEYMDGSEIIIDEDFVNYAFYL